MTVEDVGRFACFASEVLEAAEELRRDAEFIRDNAPHLHWSSEIADGSRNDG